MEFEYNVDGFFPYDSFENIYSERVFPEFGLVKSPYVRELNSWRFMMAQRQGEVPFGVESASFDDSDWDIINTPSTMQTEGYGLPQNLLYNYPEELERNAKRNEESISDKYVLHSSVDDNDEVGIYRTNVVFAPDDIDRAIYLEASGICGSFAVYLNGQLVAESHSIFTRKRLLLSETARAGVNQLTIIVNRWDRNRHGKIIKDIAAYGFSGIFRPVYIVAEPLLEMSGLQMRMASAPAAYVSQLVVADPSSTELSTESARVSRGDYTVKADFRLRNHTDYPLPFSVDVFVLEARAEYDPYKLPYVKLAQQKTLTGTIDAHKTIQETIDFVALDVAQWSDATPVQYDIVFVVKDSEGRTITSKKKRFGFRTTEIYTGKLNINDRRVPLMLTRYFEFDPMGGIAVPLDRMRQDIILMKRCGINGVISQGFPASDEFLNLCDQYGIYVIASADRKVMEDYVHSVLNHPSVIMWALNDYGYNASEYQSIKNKCSAIDDTRPWYCGADDAGKVSDLPAMPNEGAIVFGPWEDLCLDRANIVSKNKTGKNIFESIMGRTHFRDDSAEYKWIHHADLVGEKQKANSSIGQGIVDSERNPHPIYLDIKKQCQSISIFAANDDPLSLTMRNLHPFAFTPDLLLEWKVMVGGNSVLSGKGSISEIEPYGIRTLRFPAGIARFLMDGWASGNAKLIEMYMNSMSHEVIFDISLKLATDTYYAREGYEVAFYQSVLADEAGNPVAIGNTGDVKSIDSISVSGLMVDSQINAKLVRDVNDPDEIEHDGSGDTDTVEGEVSIYNENNVERMAPSEEIAYGAGFEEESSVSALSQAFRVEATPDSINVINETMKVSFSRKTGAVNGINLGGYEFLRGSFMPSFYRCPSNIDRTDRNFVLARTIFSKESDYEEIQESLKFVGSRYSTAGGKFTYVSRYKSFAMKDDILICYEMASADKIRLTLNFTPNYNLVRYGFRVPIIKDNLLCKWYGRGPGESYYDRKNATRFGLFAAGADKIYHPYARPAENSSHCDTSAMQLISEEGKTLEFRRVPQSGNNRFEFTVLPYTPEQMNEFLHEEQLLQNDYCELFLDFCSKEIERTAENISQLPLKKGVKYNESFDIIFK